MPNLSKPMPRELADGVFWLRLAQAASELAAVLRAIERRDAESAAQCFAIHVRNAGEAALARIDAGPLPSYVPMHDQPA
jgi:DNA-binding GntR family transcriptional regulator